MKKISYLFISSLTMIGVALLAFTHSHNTAIIFNETKTSYQLRADYNPTQTTAVMHYIDEALKPEAVFNSQVEQDKQVVLPNQTHIYIKASAGKLLLRLDKTVNTKVHCEQMRVLFKDIAKNAIKPD